VKQLSVCRGQWRARHIGEGIETVEDFGLTPARLAKLRAALARRRATPLTRPGSGMTAREGMRAKASGKGARGVNPGRIGSVSAQGKAAQARRDG